jgi:serine phosphatase RsbU (regulator of sigma subunit)
LLCRDGRAQEIDPPGYKLPLGVHADGAYRDAEAELQPGDVVIFSSDGLVEAPSSAAAVAPEHLPAPTAPAELLGFERLARSAAHWSARAASAEAVAAGMWSDLIAWAGAESHHDDVALLVLRVTEAAR